MIDDALTLSRRAQTRERPLARKTFLVATFLRLHDYQCEKAGGEVRKFLNLAFITPPNWKITRDLYLRDCVFGVYNFYRKEETRMTISVIFHRPSLSSRLGHLYDRDWRDVLR